MALRYKVLERFSEEARREVAGRVFDRPRWHYRLGRQYSCAQGVCIFTALLRADGIPCRLTHPAASTIGKKLGVRSVEEEYEIDNIVSANDTGQLATPEAVRALLLGDTTPTGAAAAGGAS